MTTINDGGPAFPVAEDLKIASALDWSCGMTLRDYFAAKAMHALLTVDGTTYFPNRAKEAYDMADSMLAARKAK
jgi:hypothetical protein